MMVASLSRAMNLSGRSSRERKDGEAVSRPGKQNFRKTAPNPAKLKGPELAQVKA
jgi:hypothetical protein